MLKHLTRWLFLGIGLALLPGRCTVLAQELPTSRPGLLLRLKELPGAKSPARQLYTVVNGKEYPIDRLLTELGVARLDGYQPEAGQPAWYVDPTGNYLYYTVLTGCGWENDGMAIYRSDLFGKRIEPLLGRCDNLKMEGLAYGGKNLLLIREGNSGVGDTGFWLFDLATLEPLVHAGGTLEAKPGSGNFRYCDGNAEEAGSCREIAMEVLLNRKSPLRLLPRFPLTARTAADGVELRQLEGSASCGTAPTVGVEKIPQKGSWVAVLDSCKGRGVYEVYYRGLRGTVSKSQLVGFQIK